MLALLQLFDCNERRWIDTGLVVTSAGISAGIDMSLHLVARLESKDLAVRTSKQMEYDWQNLFNGDKHD